MTPGGHLKDVDNRFKAFEERSNCAQYEEGRNTFEYLICPLASVSGANRLDIFNADAAIERWSGFAAACPFPFADADVAEVF